MNVNIALLSISLIAIFGFVSEILFRRTNIPDVIFLIIIGVYFRGANWEIIYPWDPVTGGHH